MNIFKKVFHHFVGHQFEYKKGVNHPSEVNPLSAFPQTAKIYRCWLCGEEKRELTDAGRQQVYQWGDELSHVLGLEGIYKTE
jgi:hypothetical protein